MLKDKLQRLGLDRRLKLLYEKYERVFIPTFLVLGFVTDIVTFRTLKLDTNLTLLSAYLFIIAGAFVYVYTYDAYTKPPTWKLLKYVRFALPFVTQIMLGSLLSSALLFYWYSGSLSVSWPLFALAAGLMVSSELFRHIYLKPPVQFAVYNFVLLSYLSVLLPFLLQSLNSWLFILAGIISTLVSLVLVLGISELSLAIKRQQPQILLSVLSVFVVMAGFYFAKLIPPLPLSIREAGIYHGLIREDGVYTLVGEDETFWEQIIPGQTFHANPDDDVYAYTAIFAPTALATEIYHHWEYRDPVKKTWTDQGLLHFSIRGGRSEGYRGYTYKTYTTPGRWRVTVQNERGQVLGRLTFTVVGEE
jgi:hypothetical protein